MTTKNEAEAQRFKDFRTLIWVFIYDVTGHDVSEWPLYNQPDYHALYDDYTESPVNAGTWFCIESHALLDYPNREDIEQLLDYYRHSQASQADI